MASYLVMYTVPSEHLEYLIKHPSYVYNYLSGRPVAMEGSTLRRPSFLARLFTKSTGGGDSPPADWPTSALKPIDMEINHRNVDLYHCLLNGSPEFVTGSGCIFQTWFAEVDEDEDDAEDGNRDEDEYVEEDETDGEGRRGHDAGVFGDDANGEEAGFYFTSDRLPQLLNLVERVTDKQIAARYSAWLAVDGKPSDVHEDEVARFHREFINLREALANGVASSMGLVWVER